jgi:hypothetical protein
LQPLRRLLLSSRRRSIRLLRPVEANSHADPQPQWTAGAMFGACAATTKSRHAKHSASHGRISQAPEPPAHVRAPDGRDLRTDPDAAIRLELRRDSSMGGM